MSKHALLGLAATLAALGCGSSDGGTSEDPLPLVFETDPAVVPAYAELPGFEDGATRPLAAVVDEAGRQAEFVENELWVSSDDDAELTALLATWDGVVLATIDPAATGLTDLPRQHLVRLEPGSAAAEQLARDVVSLQPEARGTLRVSSARGLALLAAAAHEAAAGRAVGVNWVGLGDGFRERLTVDAPAGQSWGDVSYASNAFGWPSHATDAPQATGVAEAWRMLEVAGRLENRVKLAVLDMGFVPDEDFPAHVAISNVPFTAPTGTANLLGCSGGGGCPWHGTNVVSAAMAVPDNGYGSAGPAGPVAEAVLVFTLYDFFTSISAVTMARAAGARIVNMSYGAPVPAVLSWSAAPFELTTGVLRAAGTLLFASAGNAGTDVDEQDCFLGLCWEDTLHTPCENLGVTCVGGLAWNATTAAGGSNWGSGGGVHLFTPYTQWLGPDPTEPANDVTITSGTSFSSPFAAGVAALVWAANPALTAGAVADILTRTARVGGGRVSRSIDARAAVTAALGDAPPFVRIVAPADGTSVSRTTAGLRLRADAEDLEDGTPTVTWTSDRDGTIGTGPERSFLRPSFGRHRITAEAVDRRGQRTSASVTVTLTNDRPRVSISDPPAGARYYRSSTIVASGSGSDPNDGALTGDQLTWYLDGNPVPLGTGVTATIPGGSLDVGRHVLHLYGTDGELDDGEDREFHIDEDPAGNVPPTAGIVTPAAGELIVVDRWDDARALWYAEVALCGRATDPEDDPFPSSGLSWWRVEGGVTTSALGDAGADGCLTVRFDLLDPYETEYFIELRATDSAGDSGTARRSFLVYGVF
jgi:hypothetical protein